MAKIINYAAVKAAFKPEHHLVVVGGEHYTLEGFQKLNFRTKTFEYLPGTVQLYDKRNQTYSDVPPVTDRTPKKTPGQLVDEAPAQIVPDFSKPPAGFVPGPLPEPAPASAPAAEPIAPDNTTADPSTPA